MEREETRRRYGRENRQENQYEPGESRARYDEESRSQQADGRNQANGRPWAGPDAWPPLGMGGFPGYWSPSQWGAAGMGVGIGPNTADYQYRGPDRFDYYDRDQGSRPSPVYHGYGHESHVGKGPKGYQRTDDRIHEEICERLTRHPDIDASEIEVKVKNGEVTLSGHVIQRRIKHMAEDAVDSVSGVKDIHNHLKVKWEAPDWMAEAGAHTREGRDGKK